MVWADVARDSNVNPGNAAHLGAIDAPPPARVAPEDEAHLDDYSHLEGETCDLCGYLGDSCGTLEFYGPLVITNHHPTTEMFLTPVPQPATVLEPDETSLTLRLDWVNNIIRELDSGVIFDLDFEGIYATAEYRRGLLGGEMSARLPVSVRTHGILDSMIADWHRAFGLRNGHRDDLPDYGASAFVGVIRSIRRQAPGCKVEVLTPDFRGQEMPLARVIAERPDVFNHNVEVAPRLYPMARRGSTFERSTRVLRLAKEIGGDEVITKSGLMVGLGESFEEMVEAFGILREHRVQVLTVGQYLRPTERHLPVVRYWEPEEFEALEREARRIGFEAVAAGPLVRSSYHADEAAREARVAQAA